MLLIMDVDQKFRGLFARVLYEVMRPDAKNREKHEEVNFEFGMRQ